MSETSRSSQPRQEAAQRPPDDRPVKRPIHGQFPPECSPEPVSCDCDEEWRPVVGWEGLYSVSNLGRVKRHSRAKTPRKRTADKCLSLRYRPYRRYEAVHLYRDGKWTDYYVHNLVAEAFIGPRPKGQEINHKDGVQRNNRADNLEYCTRRENLHHAIRLGNFGALKHGQLSTVLTGLDVNAVRRRRRSLLAGLAVVAVITLTRSAPAHASQPCPSYQDVAARFGTYPGSSVSEASYHYSARFDLDGDRRINVSDIVLAMICEEEANA